jgi:hypothetical protein
MSLSFDENAYSLFVSSTAICWPNIELIHTLWPGGPNSALYKDIQQHTDFSYTVNVETSLFPYHPSPPPHFFIFPSSLADLLFLFPPYKNSVPFRSRFSITLPSCSLSCPYLWNRSFNKNRGISNNSTRNKNFKKVFKII